MEPEIVSFGEWHMIDEGFTEVRYIIGRDAAGYRHEIETSFLGGDYGGEFVGGEDVFESKEAAIAAAKTAMWSRWENE